MMGIEILGPSHPPKSKVTFKFRCLKLQGTRTNGPLGSSGRDISVRLT